MDEFFLELDRAAKDTWATIHQKPFWTYVRSEGLNRALYEQLMREVFHYTRHNSQNQALAAARVFSDQLRLLKFALHHAYEEAGHDQMVLRDLKSIGLDAQAAEQSEPLPETQGFISYLYMLSREQGPIARLGYSYWAESCYADIKDVTDSMRKDLKLTDQQMTFFVAHSAIDEGHFAAVKKTIEECARSAADKAAIKSALVTSLHLQGVVLDGVFAAYLASQTAGRQA